MELREGELLASHTTFALGGPARAFAVVTTLEDVREALAYARAHNLKTVVFGGGSNVLAGDEGFDGLVLCMSSKGISIQHSENVCSIVASAGESWDDIVARAVQEGAWGIENLSGIPGTVGGAVVQNIGAYGAALSQTLTAVEVLDTTTDTVQTLSSEQCRFGYRSSLFKEEEGRYIVLSTTLTLSLTPAPNLAYKDLHTRFGGVETPVLGDIRAAVLEIRAQKFPDLSKEGTAGSFFKNPFVSDEQAEQLLQQYPDMPIYTSPDQPGKKINLAWVLDKALNLKGTQVGGARLFEKQPLVIATSAGATARDVQELATLVEKKVSDTLHIHIEPEVKIL
jgi:UDP-N-acetylmuramate dehydrogenase